MSLRRAIASSFASMAALVGVLGACDSKKVPEPLAMTPPPPPSFDAPPGTAEPLFSTRTVSARQAPATHLVVLLHGFGADADDLVPVARSLAADLPRLEVVLPNGLDEAPGGSGRQWFSLAGISPENRAERTRAAAARLEPYLVAELARRGLADDKLVLAGFSQGAIMAAWLASHRAVAPAALVMLSGRFANDGTSRNVSFPAFVGHGARDPVIPVAEADASFAALTRLGARVEKHVYPSLQHGIGPDELRDLVAFLTNAVAR